MQGHATSAVCEADGDRSLVFRGEVGGVRVKTDNGALDVLYSKRLLDRGREPYSHAVMEEHHRWKIGWVEDQPGGRSTGWKIIRVED